MSNLYDEEYDYDDDDYDVDVTGSGGGSDMAAALGWRVAFVACLVVLMVAMLGFFLVPQEADSQLGLTEWLASPARWWPMATAVAGGAGALLIFKFKLHG